MAFRGRPTAEVPIGLCWCGAEALRVEFGPDDSYEACTADVFHHPTSSPGTSRGMALRGRNSNREKGTTMTDPWADDDFKDGEYYSFKDVPFGTTVSGVIVKIDKASFTENGITKVVPQVLMKDDATGDEKTLTAGAFQLKKQFIEKRPQVGDHVKVTLTGDEAIGNGKRVRHWDVVVNGGAPAATPAAVAAPVVAAPVAAPVAQAAPIADPAAAQAAIANLTPEQLASLGLTPATA